MARRKPKKSSLLDSDFARPIGSLILLGLLYLAYQLGFLAVLAEIPIDILREGVVPAG